MKKVREKVTRFYLSHLATTGSPEKAMRETVAEYRWKRSTIYKWLRARQSKNHKRILRRFDHE